MYSIYRRSNVATEKWKVHIRKDEIILIVLNLTSQPTILVHFYLQVNILSRFDCLNVIYYFTIDAFSRVSKLSMQDTCAGRLLFPDLITT